jgi:hypothetical protein
MKNTRTSSLFFQELARAKGMPEKIINQVEKKLSELNHKQAGDCRQDQKQVERDHRTEHWPPGNAGYQAPLDHGIADYGQYNSTYGYMVRQARLGHVRQ